MFKKNIIILLSVTLALAGCASSSDSITESYVSPLKYNSYTCSQLEQEYARTLQRSHAINKKQDQIASNDQVAMGVGLILFWPALFFIDSDDNKEEVSRLKGELSAIEQASIRQDCLGLAQQINTDREMSRQRAAVAREVGCDRNIITPTGHGGSWVLPSGCDEKAAESNQPTDSYKPQPARMDKPEHLLEKTKSTCEELGFTQGTEKFGDCVLQLMN